MPKVSVDSASGGLLQRVVVAIKTHAVPLLVLLAVSAFGVVQVALNAPVGRGLDTFIHLYHIDFVTRALMAGNLFPAWDSLTGFGNPALAVYSPLAFYVAQLFAVGGAFVAYKLTVFASLFASGAAMYALLFKTCKHKASALVGGAGYMLANWHIVDVGFRGSFTLNLIYVLMPLVFLFFLRLLETRQEKWLYATAFALAAAILTHIYSAVMVGFFMAVFAAVLVAFRKLDLKDALRYVLGIGALALLLSAFWSVNSFYTYSKIMPPGENWSGDVNFLSKSFPPTDFFAPFASQERFASLDARFGALASEKLGALGLGSSFKEPAMLFLGKYGSITSNQYLGFGLLLIALAAFPTAARWRKEQSGAVVAAFFVLLAVSVLLATNKLWFLDFSAVTKLVYQSIRFLTLSTFFLAFLAGIGFAQLCKLRGKSWAIARIVLLAFLVIDLAPAPLLVSAGLSSAPFLDATQHYLAAYEFIRQQPGTFAIAEQYQFWQQAHSYYAGYHGKRSVGYPHFLLDPWMPQLNFKSSNAAEQLGDYSIKYVIVRNNSVTDVNAPGLSTPISLNDVKDPALQPVFWSGDLVVLENKKFRQWARSANNACAVDVVQFSRFGAYNISAQCSAPDELVLNEIALPGWTATVNGVQTRVTEPKRGLLAVSLPQGKSIVEVSQQPTIAVFAGIAASLATLAFIVLRLRNAARGRKERA